MREFLEYQDNRSCPFCRSAKLVTVVAQDDFVREQQMVSGLKQDAHFSLQPKISYTQQYPAAVIQCADCGLGFRSRTPTIEEQEQTYADEKMSQDYIEAWEKSWQPIFGRLLTALEKRTKGRGALLDIGSQFGLFAFLASQGGWDAYGLDQNKYTIERAKQRGVKFYEGTFTSVQVPDNFYDAVTAWLVFDNLPNFYEETKKVGRILKEGGLFAIKISNFAFYKNLRNTMLSSETGRVIFSRLHLMGFPYQYGFTPTTIYNLLNNAGFSGIEVHNYRLTTCVNPQLRPEVVTLERVSKSLINTISGGIEIATGGRVIIGPWLEVYARKKPKAVFHKTD